MYTKLSIPKRISVWMRRKQASIVSNVMQELYDDARDELQRAFEKSSTRMRAYQQELESRIANLSEFMVGTDDFKIKRRFALPIMTQQEKANYRNLKYTALVLELLMWLFDAYFGSLIVPFIIPHANPVTQLILGGSIAAIIIFCIHFGVDNLMSYLEGKRYLRIGELKDYDRPMIKTRLYIAIPLLAIGLAATFAIAMVRETLLSAIHVTGGSNNSMLDQLSSKAELGSKYASFATLMLAFIVIFLFSYLRYKIRDYKLKAKLAKKYETNKNRIERLILLINSIDSKFTSRFTKLFGRAWSLMLHARRILKRVVDQEFIAKFESYLLESEKPGFTLTKEIYLKYRNVGSGDEELYTFGITSHRDVLKIWKDWSDLMAAINFRIATYKTAHHFDPFAIEAQIQPGLNLATITIVAVGCSILSSCDFLKSHLGNVTEPKLEVIAFVDISASTDTMVCKTYVESVRELLDSLPAGSNIKVLPLDGATERNSKEFVSAAIPASASFANDLDPPYQAEQLKTMRFKNFKDSLAKVMARALTNVSPLNTPLRKRNETDVLGAFRLLPIYSQSEDTSTRKMAVIYSDMLSCNKELDLERRHYSQEQLTNLTDNIAAVDLHSWNICIFTGDTRIDNQQYIEVKQFWTRYLSKCRSESLLYVSGSKDLLLSRMQQLKKSGSTKHFF